MCFNYIIVTMKPSNEELKVTLKTTVSGAWDKIGDILSEHVNDSKFTGGEEQEEINKVLDGVVNFLEDFVENYENILCEDNCEYCELMACQENIMSILDLTNKPDIRKVSEIVEITYFDGHVY